MFIYDSEESNPTLFLHKR